MLIYISDKVLFENATTLIPVGGQITITQSTHLIDTEAGAPIAYVNTIVGRTVENLLYIRVAAPYKSIVLQHNVGNILLAGDDIVLDNIDNFALLLYNSVLDKWILGGINDAGTSGTSGTSGVRGQSGTSGTSGTSFVRKFWIRFPLGGIVLVRIIGVWLPV